MTAAHPFSPDGLTEVWRRLRWRGGRDTARELAVGVDGMRADAFERTLGRQLAEISRRVLRLEPDGLPSYRFGPLLQFEHPKPGGGRRLIHVARIRDQVVLRALHEQVCAGGQRAHGIRLQVPEPRPVLAAFRRLAAQPGAAWALRADIRSFFDAVPREAAVELAAATLEDPLTRGLLRRWSQGVSVRPAWRAGRGRDELVAGLPQGLSLSASLAELWASRLDGPLAAEFPYLRFVDDIVMVGADRAEMERARDVLAAAVGRLGLELSPAKTRILPLSAGVPWLGLIHRPEGARPDPTRVDKWLQRFVSLRRRAGRELQASAEAGARREAVRRFHAGIRSELVGRANWRVRWYALAEDDGSWRELDRSLHAMIRSLHRHAGEPPPTGRRLPSVHRALRYLRLSAPPSADQGPCANLPPPGGDSADQGPKASGGAESR
jgi:hypothetical protein